MKKISEGAIVAFVVVVLIICVGLAGQLDHDEYIEANSRATMQITNK